MELVARDLLVVAREVSNHVGTALTLACVRHTYWVHVGCIMQAVVGSGFNPKEVPKGCLPTAGHDGASQHISPRRRGLSSPGH